MQAKFATGTPIDKLLDGGLEQDAVTNVYGPAGSGKTNIALAAALSCLESGKAVYMDTEGSFSLERFRQMGGTDKDLKNIVMMHVHSWQEQNKGVEEIEKLLEKEKSIGLIIVDSLVALYRLELDEKNFQAVNKQLATQYSVLSRIVRKRNIPVLVTNQIYSKGDSVEMTSRTIGRYWSKTLIELKRSEKENQRLAILRKHRSLPEGRYVEFEITKDGLKQVGKFSLF
jgi:DNA repair protein RadB